MLSSQDHLLQKFPPRKLFLGLLLLGFPASSSLAASEERVLPSPDPGLGSALNQPLENKPERCHPVDLRPSLPPVRNQGRGWCYAFVSADLLSQRLDLRGDQAVSPYHMAATYYKVIPGLMGSGDSEVHQAFRSRQEFDRLSPLDREREDQAQGFFWHRRRGGYEYNALLAYSTLERVCTNSALPFRGFEKAHDQFFIRRMETQAEEEVARLACRHLRQTREGFVLPPQILEQVNQIQDRLYQDLSEKCTDGPILPRGLVPAIVETKTKEAGILASDRALDRGRAAAITVDLTSWRPFKDTNELTHSMMVVGRYWDQRSGSCVYRIRNSWGANCSRHFRNRSIRCEPDGTLVVPQRLLQSSTQSLMYFP